MEPGKDIGRSGQAVSICVFTQYKLQTARHVVNITVTCIGQLSVEEARLEYSVAVLYQMGQVHSEAETQVLSNKARRVRGLKAVTTVNKQGAGGSKPIWRVR